MLDIIMEPNGKESFKLHFLNSISEAYILKYDSLIIAKDHDMLSNTVNFKGQNVKPISHDSNSDVTVLLSNSSDTVSGVRGPIMVYQGRCCGS